MSQKAGTLDWGSAATPSTSTFTGGRWTSARAQQVQVKLYVDKERLLPVRISYRFRHAETKRWVEVAQTYGNFQMRGGVLTPLQEARWTNGRRTAEVFYDRILYNAPVKETTFLPQR